MKEREEQLRGLISRAKDACDKKKWMRVRRTFFVLTGVLYLVAFYYSEINNIKEFLGYLIGVPFMAVFIMIASAFILLYIMSGGHNDEIYIAKLEGELNATVRFNHKINKDEL